MLINNVEIKMFPAGSGDCILIHFIKENFRILIDGGFITTYENFLKSYLTKIKNNGGHIDLLIVTHIDRDHINGIKRLLEDNGDANNPQIISINEIWFNSFRNIFSANDITNGPISFLEKGILKNMASNNTEPNGSTVENVNYEDGNCLAELIVKNGYSWNSSFKKAVAIDDTSKIEFGNISLSILNPTVADLDDLATEWINEIKRQCKTVVITDNHLFDKAFEGCFVYDKDFDICEESISYSDSNKVDWEKCAESNDAKPDSSIANLSSIAILINYEENNYLFAGDCPIGKIKQLLPNSLTVVKLPHHGSGKSNEKSFIRESKVKYYLISTDGSYGHPSKVIVGNILCKAPEKSTIVNNYKLPLLDGVSVLEEDLIVNE